MVGLIRRRSSHLSGRWPIGLDSEETYDFLVRKTIAGKGLSNSDEPDAFVLRLDIWQGIRSSLLLSSTGELLMHRVPITVILCAALIVVSRFSEGQTRPKLVQKTERFDADPEWEGFNNRVPPKKGQIVKQDFGYSTTHFAGRAAGAVGGLIQRSTPPASDAAQIAPISLNNKLTAAGTFAIP